MHFEGHDESIPRIVIEMEEGKTSCYVFDTRFGHVFYDGKSGKQGMHLFSVAYCLSSLAVYFNERTIQNIALEITNSFHINFLTKLLINKKYKPLFRETVFPKYWENQFLQLLESYNEFLKFLEECSEKCNPKCDDAYPHPMSLQNYLNYIGVLHHIFPCNVVYSDNATDPLGGNNAKTAIKNLAEFYKKPKSHDLIRDIDSIIDKKAIGMIFQNGFDDNNILCLAFIILQIHDLLAIRTSSENYRHSISKYKEMQEIVLKTVFYYATNGNHNKFLFEGYKNYKNEEDFKEKFNKAFNSSLDIIQDKRSTIQNNISCQARIEYEIFNRE